MSKIDLLDKFDKYLFMEQGVIFQKIERHRLHDKFTWSESLNDFKIKKMSENFAKINKMIYSWTSYTKSHYSRDLKNDIET